MSIPLEVHPARRAWRQPPRDGLPLTGSILELAISNPNESDENNPKDDKPEILVHIRPIPHGADKKRLVLATLNTLIYPNVSIRREDQLHKRMAFRSDLADSQSLIYGLLQLEKMKSGFRIGNKECIDHIESFLPWNPICE